MMNRETLKTKVLIIGAGVTGTGIARDLALRGVTSVVVEKEDVNNGASGANHGLLHSGARYVCHDTTAAVECREENAILKRVVPQCIEDTGGLFVAVEGDDERFVADFPHLCARCGIPCRAMDVAQAREIEPHLSPKLIAAYAVPDGSIDPFRLSLENMAQAEEFGSRLLLHSRVTEFTPGAGNIRSVLVKHAPSGRETRIEADYVVNASGAWAGETARMAGVSLDILYSKGSLIVADTRLTQRAINRLRPSSDADIVVPGGTVTILGTTSIRLASLDDVHPTIEETDFIIDTASEMMPVLRRSRYLRAYAGVRPLFGDSNADDREVSRGYALIDHAREGRDNFVTITGGKVTTYRKMAEETVDLVCAKMGITARCITADEPLPSRSNRPWTQPGISPMVWLQNETSGDSLLCECEMVPANVVDSIVHQIRSQGGELGLKQIGVRSRIGKGLCQGTFCSGRITAYLYDQGEFSSEEGLKQMQSFLNGRWKGIRPVLWGTSLIQEELQEAMYCGLFGLEE